MGKNGAALMLLLLFMAVTSAASAELIAVSSLWTFDVYKLYINPSASSSKLVKQAHYGIVVYSLLLAAFCCGLSASGIDITWIITAGGVLVGGGGIPLGFVVLFPTWVSTTAAVGAPLIASPSGLIAWFVTTHIRSGTITAVTTGDLTNALAGSATACGTGAVAVIALSVFFPYKYTSTDPAHIARVEKIRGTAILGGQEVVTEVALTENITSGEAKPEASERPTGTDKTATSISPPETTAPTGNDVVDYLTTNHIEPLDFKSYNRARRLAYGSCAVFFAVAIILFPFTFYGTGWIFTKAAFEGWVVVSLIWIFFSALACIIWPIVESYPALRDMTMMLVHDTFRRGETH
jgi:urea-proton symporter